MKVTDKNFDLQFTYSERKKHGQEKADGEILGEKNERGKKVYKKRKKYEESIGANNMEKNNDKKCLMNIVENKEIKPNFINLKDEPCLTIPCVTATLPTIPSASLFLGAESGILSYMEEGGIIQPDLPSPLAHSSLFFSSTSSLVQSQAPIKSKVLTENTIAYTRAYIKATKKEIYCISENIIILPETVLVDGNTKLKIIPRSFYCVLCKPYLDSITQQPKPEYFCVCNCEGTKKRVMSMIVQLIRIWKISLTV